MPALMTHDFFGKDTWDSVAHTMGFATLAEHDAYLLGNQGPDPLFYLMFDPMYNKYQPLGALMHHVRTTQLLVNLHDSLSMLSAKERKIGAAYAAGFLAHYLLDSTVHPYVYTLQYALCDAGVEGLTREDGQVVHAEIERDLDEMVLFTKKKQTVAHYRPYREVLQASKEVLAVIDKMYFYLFLWTFSKTIPMDLYSHALHMFRRTQRTLYSPYGALRKIFGTVERVGAARHYSLYVAMAHRARESKSSDFDNSEHALWTNCFTGAVSHESFWDLFEHAKSRLLPALQEMSETTFDEASAKKISLNLNFSGESEKLDLASDAY